MAATDAPDRPRHRHSIRAAPPHDLERFRHRLWLGGIIVLGLWLIGLMAFSSMLYHRANLTADYATYNQVWTLIGTGHLNPYGTVWLHNTSFIKGDFELILWPLAVLHVLSSEGVVLLWVQDLAVAATGLIAFRWILEFLQRAKVSMVATLAIGSAVLAVIIVDPIVYQTLLFDFHMEPISTAFIVLAGRDFWLGRHRRAWIWIALALLCGSFAAITVIGLGVSALLAGPSTRRAGLLVMVAGLAWIGLITTIGANEGSALEYYAYLAGRTTLPASGGVVILIAGMLGHPNRVIDQIHLRLHYIWLLIKPVGIIGLASAWGFGVPVAVLTVDALNSQYGFIFQAFQNFAVFPFVLVGTVMVLVYLVTYGITNSPGNVRWAVDRVGAAQAAQLRKALQLTPPNAQTIVTIGVMGRFSSRTSAYFYAPSTTIAVASNPVVFVFDPANEDTVPFAVPADDVDASSFVRDVLHARVLVDQAGVTAYLWQPPPGTHSVTFPPSRVQPPST